MLATKGNLVFQGNSSGRFAAYRADTGEELWSAAAQTGIIAPPVTYSIDGEQYVTVVAGWGGAFALAAGGAAEKLKLKNRGRILTYKLGANVQLPPIKPAGPIPEPPSLEGTDEQIAHGKGVYHQYCGVCHGPGAKSGGVIKDLRHMPTGVHLVFEDIVLGGIMRDRGMVGFADVLDREDVVDIQQYIIQQAHRLKEKERFQ